MSQITIYHNPKCSKSRNTLAAIRERDIEPQIIHYLDNPPDEATLRKLIADSGISVRDAMRENEALYQELNPQGRELDDDERITMMLAHPVLIQRPFVVTEKGTRLCRPESLLEDIFASP